MKNRKLGLLATLLIIAVAIIITGQQLSSRRPSDSAMLFFPKAVQSDISSVVIVENQDTVALKKKGDVWVVLASHGSINTSPAIMHTPDLPTTAAPASAGELFLSEYPVDSAAIVALLDKLKAMKKDELMSENPAKQGVYEVDSIKGLLVKVWDSKGKLIGNFRIGKNGPDWSSNFVRSEGSNLVYMVGGSIRYAFFGDHKRWHDKTICKFDVGTLKKVTLTKLGGNVVTVEKRSDTLWEITTPQVCPAKKDDMNTLATALAALNATNIEEDATQTASSMSLDNPQLIISAELSSGATKTVRVGSKKNDGANQFWVTADDKKGVFLVSDATLAIFDKNIDNLKFVDPAVAAASAAPKGKKKK